MLEKCFVLTWKQFDRWGVAFNQRVFAGVTPESGKYPTVRLGEAVADLENGWSPKCLTRPVEGEEWGVLKLGAVSFGAFNDKENKALPSQLKPIPALEVKPGQVLISRANIPRLVGACALIKETRPHLMLCDKIFRVVFRDNTNIDPAYLAEVMKIPHLREQIESACTGTSPTMQNITKPSLLALRLPLPPLTVQKQIMERVAAGRAEIARKRDAANTLAKDIHADIEALILGTRTVHEN
jgi:type I restriction enzyme S subunit